MSTKVVLLGTSGFYPSCVRHTACVLLPDLRIMFDAGTGVCRLGKFGLDNRLDIFLTHAHLDHIAGLTYLFDILPQEMLANVVIRGAEDKLAAVREHLFAEAIFPVAPPFRFESLDGPVSLSGGARISYFPLKHPGGSLGYRLDMGDRAMAYVTDTVAAPRVDYIGKIQGVDLLLHEANFVNDGPMTELTGHSHVLAAAEVAAAADVGQLVLVHLNSQLEDDSEIDLAAARRIFEHTVIGADCMELRF